MTIEALQNRAEQILRNAGVMPVLTVDSVDQGLRMADALAEGGLKTLELTLRTPAAMSALAAIKKARPDILVGAGTVLSADQAQASIDVGADFLVTPGTPAVLAEALAKAPIPAVPGAATPTEFIALMALGFRVCKLFPASVLGGIAMARNLAGPLAELRLCANGGVNEASAADYLAEPNVLCVGGSWMLPKSWLANGEWDKVRNSAAKAAQIVAKARGAG
ncbi:MAG TPA: bifunctional 4-hydroxy-2-oxoglutarate aldolase/2-dehydro-3-deoxy-phosphogluconate aldolase [Luteimonas sp.]|nr:bifunctional 4-hydroxy-2-oxoglutarate aldolase/2-dehydro-3-deoxy-phosphogluconate aldolase [Luteimonas sp.]HRO26564.1 bifunctional 4-hydroxy-2-oxoglutarate aldolase/2-dehydro-3-deoxy-phosphogluconate aldolase [Luteimonas sp.]HRP72406.1 bifunctional 4-hydroxy-2-oxoglutarate aldolase/2-dehydro-3-deoxy-phosphogluconate aldolase [Luteimonas sp.]